MAASRRIAIVIDDELQRGRFAAQLGLTARIHQVARGDELRALAAARTLDVVVVGVLNREDEFLSSILLDLSRTRLELTMVGVFEPSRPSLDEAADLAREIPAMGFVCRPGSRFEHLIQPRPADLSPTFTPALVNSIRRLPLYGAARDFALLQALHPSLAQSIPEQARELGVSRRNLERWFQGPDICSAGCFQSVCAAAEAAYLRLFRGMAEHQTASVVDILTGEGLVNPMGVSRTIRSALRLGLEELRAGGAPALMEAVHTALRTSRDPTRAPAQWELGARCAPERGVLAVRMEDRIVLMDPGRGIEHALDQFGTDAWLSVQRGEPFLKLVQELASIRQEPTHLVRTRLISWLGELLVLGLIRREPPSAEADEA